MNKGAGTGRGVWWPWPLALVCGAMALMIAAVLWTPSTGHAQDAADEPGKQIPSLMAVEPATTDEVLTTPAGELFQEGRQAYRVYCIGCHGENGDGRGPAAAFLFPKPRDFTQAIFKFSSRPSGGLPTERDLLQTLDHGLAGTSMREWRLLPTHTKLALIAYIKSFAPERWGEVEDEDQPIAITEDPWRDGDEDDGVARGEVVYHALATCWQCHASYVTPGQVATIREEEGLPAATLRENVMEPSWKVDQWGDRIWPPDFTRDRIKYGSDVRTLYRVIAAGIGGTAMPAWKGVLEEDDIWAMAYYVQHKAQERNERVMATAGVAGE